MTAFATRPVLRPISRFPMARRAGFANINLRIEIGGKGLAVIATIAIENISFRISDTKCF